MKQRGKIRVFAETVPAFMAFLVIPWIPRSLLVLLTRGLGHLAFLLSKRQRYVALANLLTVFNKDGRLSEKEVREIALESFQTMILTALDVFWFSVRTEKRLRKYIDLDESAELYATRKGGIAVAAHFGNWEILGQAGALYLDGLLSVAAELRNPFVNKMISRSRQVTGQKVVYQDGAVRQLMKALKSETVVAMLIDQNVVPAEGGVFVDMFGLPVPVSRAIAAMAAKADVQVAFLYCIADKHGRYKIFASPLPDVFDGSDTHQGITQAVIRLIEDAIRGNPGKWMWAYKRWKFIPEGVTEKGYPTYARPIEPPEMGKGAAVS
jgi:KDO2-lipid IV(A) lauroyltransferase